MPYNFIKNIELIILPLSSQAGFQSIETVWGNNFRNVETSSFRLKWPLNSASTFPQLYNLSTSEITNILTALFQNPVLLNTSLENGI